MSQVDLTGNAEHRAVPLIAAVALAMGTAFYWIMWEAEGVGINVLVVQAAFVAAVAFLAKRTGHRLAREAWVAAAFTLAFSATFGIWAAQFSWIVAGFGLLVSELVFVLYAVGHHMEFHHPATLGFTALFDVPLRVFSRIDILSHLPLPKSMKPRTRAIIYGILLLVPVSAVFLALFASADQVFALYLRDAWQWVSVPQGFGHAAGVIFFSLCFVVLFGLAFWKRHAFGRFLRPQERWHVESSVVLCGTIALFAAFIIVQAANLFGGEAAFHVSGLTYAEYARSGFNQLVIVATVVLLLFLTLRYYHGDQTKGTLPMLHSILFGETMIVLASAVLRMNLYVEAYGLTQARLFGYWFLGMVAGLLVLAYAHLAFKRPQPSFVRQGMLLCGIVAVAFIVSSPDAMAFRLNADRIIREGELSAAEVSDASADAYRTLRLLEMSGITLREFQTWMDPKDTAVPLEILGRFFNPNDWRAWNRSRSRLDRTEPLLWFGCQTEECRKASGVDSR